MNDRSISDLITEYEIDTSICSFTTMMEDSEYYKQIMYLGWEAVPHLINACRQPHSGMAVIWCLENITGIVHNNNPEPGAFTVYNVDNIKDAWVKWYDCNLIDDNPYCDLPYMAFEVLKPKRIGPRADMRAVRFEVASVGRPLGIDFWRFCYMN